MTTPAEQLEKKLLDQLGTFIFGADQIIHGITIALLNKGHVLLQGAPGLGKTLLAKSLALVLGGRFQRIQCTADMMPSDITGIHIYNEKEKEFKFIPGPLFADIVLIDEINRTGPKTQSALLQAMEENQVTIDRETHKLPESFFVIASQNPYEFEGTYPLPESQLDRFLMRLDMSYPDVETEKKILRTYAHPGGGHQKNKPETGNLLEEIAQAREQIEQVHIDESVYHYAAEIAQASRAQRQLALGISSRGILHLMQCARAEAALRSSDFVTPDDIRIAATPVLKHRLILTPDAALEDVQPEAIIDDLFRQVKVPR